jgi:four helix bundle protein
MSVIERFEDIEAWKEARKLTADIYRVTQDRNFRDDPALRDQLRRAAVSIMANIAEGFDAGSNREFLQFLSYALRSASEVQSHLYVALDQKYIFEETFSRLTSQTLRVKSLIGGFRRYLQSEAAKRTAHGARKAGP